MKNIKKLVAALAIMAVATYSSGCALVAKTPEAIANSTVATVNGDKITRAQFDQRMNLLKAQITASYGADYLNTTEGKQLLDQERTQTLDQMIDETLELQKAKELKVVTDEKTLDDQVTTQYNQIKSQYSTEAEFEQAIKQYGYDPTSLKDFIKTQSIITMLQDFETKDVTVTTADEQKYYTDNKYQFTTKPDTMHVKHILVASEAEAKTVKSRLEKGEDFATVAKEVSTDTGSKDNGGDLGDVDYVSNSLDPTFFQACLKLKVNQISDPVHTQFGYHIIVVTKKTEYPEKKFSDVQSTIKDTLLTQNKQTKFNDILSKWKKAAKIETAKYAKNLTATTTAK